MSRLQRFVAALLEREGALVEAVEPEGLEILAPPELQRRAALPEWVRLGFGAALPAGARRVGLDSDWMDCLAAVLGERGRCVRSVVDCDDRAPAEPERVLRHGLELHNATYRLRDVRPAWTRYAIASFRYSALSEERRDGIVHVGFNLATGATLDELLDALRTGAATVGRAVPEPPPAVSLPPDWEPERWAAALERALPARVRPRLESFLASLERRLRRDLARLHVYHEDLRRETVARRTRPTGPAAAGDDPDARARLRLEAIAREHRSKVADVARKYAVTVRIEWIQTLELVAPVQRFELLLRRRKAERLVHLDWSPLARRLEQAPCEATATFERPREVCDEALHLVTPPANGPCPQCGKRYCRACHPAICPRCRAT